MYRIYMTDSLNLLLAAWGVKLEMRYADTLKPPTKEEEVSSEEIISDITKKVRGY